MNSSTTSAGHRLVSESLKMKFLLVSSIILAFSAVAADGIRASEETLRSAEHEMEQGRLSFTQGSFPQAALHWMEAARIYEGEGKPLEQGQALTHVAYALQQEGQVRQSVTTLQAALKLSEEAGNRVQTAAILGRLGNAALAL